MTTGTVRLQRVLRARPKRLCRAFLSSTEQELHHGQCQHLPQFRP